MLEAFCLCQIREGVKATRLSASADPHERFGNYGRETGLVDVVEHQSTREPEVKVELSQPSSLSFMQ
jgi:hypothetical protein